MEKRVFNHRHAPWAVKILLVIWIDFSVSACADMKEKPKLNPQPQYFLTLHGVVSPKLNKTIQLTFIQAYVGSNPKCAKTTNFLAGIKENPSRSIVYHIHPESNGHYQVKIPLDRYTSGFCQWAPWALGYTLSQEDFELQSDGYGLINYDNKQSQKYNPSYINFICKNADSCHVRIPRNSDAIIYLRTNKSYTQELNILSKEEKNDKHS